MMRPLDRLEREDHALHAAVGVLQRVQLIELSLGRQQDNLRKNVAL